MAKKTAPKKAKKQVVKKAVKKVAKKAPKKAVKKAAKPAAKPAVTEEKIVSREDDFSSREVSQVPYSPGNVQEEGNKKPAILLIIVVVFGIIAFLSYLNSKKKDGAESSAPAVQEETARPVVEKEEVRKEATGEWESGLGGDKVTWEAANKRCKGKDMRLPTAKELLDYRANGPKDVVDQLKEIKARTWTADENGNQIETVYMKSGNVGPRDKSKLYRSICRN